MLYSLDSSTLISYFRGDANVKKNISEKEKNNKLIISPITYYEVSRGFMVINAKKKLVFFQEMYQNAYAVLQIPENIVMQKAAEIYAELHSKNFTVGSCDIIIAAWSILANATLVTENIKDFKNISNLQIENWKIK